MSTVYVRWYGQILQGEVVENNEEGILANMVAVRIPLQGCYPIAMFSPGNVYTSPEQVTEKSSINTPKIEVIAQKPQEIAKIDPNIANNLEQSDAWLRLQKFKQQHWDMERNHLKIEYLDEFYEYWKALSSPILIIPNFTEADIEKLAEEFSNYDGNIIYINAEPTIMMDPVEHHQQAKPIEAVQLSLFE